MPLELTRCPSPCANTHWAIDVQNFRFEILFCDDIRQEVSGKHILIGVFGTDVVPSRLPGNLPIAFYLRVFGLTKGDHEFKFTIQSETKDWKGEIEGKTTVLLDSVASIFPFGPMPVHIRQPGKLTATFSVDGGEPAEVGSIVVRTPQASPAPQT